MSDQPETTCAFCGIRNTDNDCELIIKSDYDYGSGICGDCIEICRDMIGSWRIGKKLKVKTMINTTNFIRSPSPPKGIKAAMKTRSRKGGASEMSEGDRVSAMMPRPAKPKDVLSPKRPR